MNSDVQNTVPPVEVTAENVEEILLAAGHQKPDNGQLSKRGNFKEELGNQNIHPLATGISDFQFEEIFRRLDGDGESVESASNREASKDLGQALREILLWMTKVKSRDQRAIKSVGLKVIAVAWVTNPALFGNAPSHVVAKSFGINPKFLNSRTAEFSRKFKIQNRFQAHDWQNRREAIL